MAFEGLTSPGSPIRPLSAGKPRGVGAWVFMAPRCWPLPFPALKLNPSRSFLSGGRGVYPKGFPTKHNNVKGIKGVISHSPFHSSAQH